MKNGWVKHRLRDVTTKIGSGATPIGGEAAYKSEGISLIRSLNVHDSGFRTKGLAFIDETQAEQLDNVVVEAEDILLNITGASVARCCVVPDEMLPARVNQHVSILRPKKNELLPKLLHYMLISTDYKDRLLNAGEGGGSTRQALTKSQLQEFWIEIPESLAEQRRIVGILDEAFEGLATANANAEQNLQNARALFESHLQAVFTQLRSAHPVRRLSDLCERITKGSSPTWQGMAYVDRPGVLFVTSENVHENRLVVTTPKYVEERFNEKEKRSILKFGDVLTNLVGASIGRTAVYDLHDVANINQAVGVIRCHSDKIHNHYLMYFFNSPVMKAFFHANEVNNARANISLTFVSELEVPLPPVEGQKEVVRCIREYHQNCQRLESLYQRKLAALDELKKSLLHRAFSGQL